MPASCDLARTTVIPPTATTAAIATTSHFDVFILILLRRARSKCYRMNEELSGNRLSERFHGNQRIEKKAPRSYRCRMSHTFRRLLTIIVTMGIAHVTAAADKVYTIAVIPKGSTHEHWRAV